MAWSCFKQPPLNFTLVLLEVILLLRPSSFESKYVFVIKFACTNLALKISADKVLISGVTIYLSRL